MPAPAPVRSCSRGGPDPLRYRRSWEISTKADARTRTGDPFITSEVLYQLSYVGAGMDSLDSSAPELGSLPRGCCRILVDHCLRASLADARGR
jgi:hypothetical protein